MSILSIIEHKKQGHALTESEIAEFVAGAADGSVGDAPLAALLMAIRLRGMDARETASLTMHMARSGQMLSLGDIPGATVDKHSTGGVGDTTTLVLAPLVAACGGYVAKMSGHALGHTGGTLDKLASIPGMTTQLSLEAFTRIVREVGCAIAGQTAQLAPADKRLYALRDVTGSVDSLPLIASSIMSKKLAAGCDAIVLDVKSGSGALMPTLGGSLALARAMVDIGTRAGREVSALVTDMDQPLGRYVGNALEVVEAIRTLRGQERGALLDVSLALGEQMLLSARVCPTREEARALLERKLRGGEGLRKLAQMIAAQGGDDAVTLRPELLPRAARVLPIPAERAGYVRAIDARALGLAAGALGAGRSALGQAIDPAVGLIMRARLGERVQIGQPLLELHVNDERALPEALALVRGALTLGDIPPAPRPLVLARVTREGTQTSA